MGLKDINPPTPPPPLFIKINLNWNVHIGRVYYERILKRLSAIHFILMDTSYSMITSKALDEALKQKSILQKRFESEFNQLRSTSTAQEQQLLDDFEWKLREVEQSCKKKILEAEKCKRDLEAQLLKVTAELEEVISV